MINRLRNKLRAWLGLEALSNQLIDHTNLTYGRFETARDRRGVLTQQINVNIDAIARINDQIGDLRSEMRALLSHLNLKIERTPPSPECVAVTTLKRRKGDRS